MTRRALRNGLATLAAALAITITAPAADDAANILAGQLRALLPAGASRALGQAGNAALEEMVANRFAASGFQTNALTFEAPAFIPGTASLRLANTAPVPLEFVLSLIHI